MASNHEAVEADPPSHAFAKKQRRLRVLIVEDDPIIAMELEMILEELGADVVGIAISAAETIGNIRAYAPDFATMDINIMGDSDGVTVAQEIFDKYGIRSIFISARSDVATQQRAAPCNPIGWIVKPVSKSRLAELLTRVNCHNN